MDWVQGIGPFALDDEQRLFAERGIDALVCKNSGGSATAAKLTAAKQAGVPVWLKSRPEMAAADRVFAEIEALEGAVWESRFGEVGVDQAKKPTPPIE